MVTGWQPDMPGGIKVTIEGKLYSATTDLCSGGIFFKRPVQIEKTCTHGYFFRRSNGCSMNNSDIISGKNYACANSTFGLVQAIIPLTPPELPTDHSIAFYDDPDTLKNFRRYSFAKGLRHQYSGSDIGAVGVVVTNTHNTPKIGIGYMCYEGKPATGGAAFQTDLPWYYSHRGYNDFFARKCREDSYYFQWRKARRYSYTEGYSNPEDFNGETEASLGDDGKTEEPGTSTELPFLTFPEYIDNGDSQPGTTKLPLPGDGSTILPLLTFPEYIDTGEPGAGATELPGATERPGASELPLLTFPEYIDNGGPGAGATELPGASELPLLTFPEYIDNGGPGAGATELPGASELPLLTFPENIDNGGPGAGATELPGASELPLLTFPEYIDNDKPDDDSTQVPVIDIPESTESPVEGYTGKVLDFLDVATESPVEGYAGAILDFTEEPKPGDPVVEPNPGDPGSGEGDNTDLILNFPENGEDYSSSESGEDNQISKSTQPPSTTPRDHEIIDPPTNPGVDDGKTKIDFPPIIDSAEIVQGKTEQSDNASSSGEGSEEKSGEASDEGKVANATTPVPANPSTKKPSQSPRVAVNPSVHKPLTTKSPANNPSQSPRVAINPSVNKPSSNNPPMYKPSQSTSAASSPSVKKPSSSPPAASNPGLNRPSNNAPSKPKPGPQSQENMPGSISDESGANDQSSGSSESDSSGVGSEEQTEKPIRPPPAPLGRASTKSQKVVYSPQYPLGCKPVVSEESSNSGEGGNGPTKKPPGGNDDSTNKPGGCKPIPVVDDSDNSSGGSSGDSGSGEDNGDGNSGSGESPSEPPQGGGSVTERIEINFPEHEDKPGPGNPPGKPPTEKPVESGEDTQTEKTQIDFPPKNDDEHSPTESSGTVTDSYPKDKATTQSEKGEGSESPAHTDFPPGTVTELNEWPGVVLDFGKEEITKSEEWPGVVLDFGTEETPKSEEWSDVLLDFPTPKSEEGPDVTIGPQTEETPKSEEFAGVMIDLQTEETPKSEEFAGVMIDLQTEETPKSEEWPGVMIDLQTEETPKSEEFPGVMIDLQTEAPDAGVLPKTTEKQHPGIVLDLRDRVDDSGNVIDKPSVEEEETPEEKMTEIYRHSPIRLKPIPKISDELMNWDPYIEESIYIAKSKFLKELGFTGTFDFETGKVGGSTSPSVISEQPKTMWFQILKSSADVVKASASEEILNPEFIDEVVSLFGFIFRAIPDNLKTMDDSILKMSLESIQKCQSVVKKVNVSMTGCPAKFHHVEVANPDGTSSDFNLIKSPPMQSSFRTHRNDVIVESVWNIVDIVLCSCFETFTSESVNAYHALHAYMMQTFLNERVQRRWYSAFKGVDAYAGILPQGYFKTVMYNYDKLKAALHLNCRNLPWISKPEFLVPNYAHKNVFRSSKKYFKSGFSPGRGMKIGNSIKNGDNEDPFVIGDAAITFSKPFKSRAYKKKGRIWRVKRQIATTPMEHPVLERPLVRVRREVQSPDNSLLDNNKIEIWGGMAYCLQANYIESSDGKFDMRGISPTIESLQPLCSSAESVTTEKY
ncbi:unnamed protein product [Allacma fusca]|uniref:Uncharacterized protein n=1 Tax=Allacma fusca TaxID=39272 RepID=A0A8J2PV24_9HEXA|nr:unnamed protein product [Allacma fusca]